MLALFPLLVSIVAIITTPTNNTYRAEAQAPVIPICSPNNRTHSAPVFAIISHDSIIATYFHNPEQAARDTAAILNVQIEWDRHVNNSVSTMVDNIYNAVRNV